MKAHLWHRWSPVVITLAMAGMVGLFARESLWPWVVVYTGLTVVFGAYSALRWEVLACLVCTKNEYERDKNV